MSQPFDYAFTFACYNQVDYTKKTVDSMVRNGYDLKRLVAVDNGSKDDTRNYLQTLDLGGRLFNTDNMGCGVAWNQGALHLQAEWTIVMNNDIEFTPNCIENLIGVAKQHGLKVAAPSMVEREKDYDLDAFALDAGTRMKNEVRKGDRHAVCMAIHKSAFMEAGYFRAAPKLLGFEDTLFFHEVMKAGIPLGIVGASWIHHYGSVTVKAMKKERGIADNKGLGDRNNKLLLNQNWLARKRSQAAWKTLRKEASAHEKSAYGITMLGYRENGDFVWV
jgi:GT2 family glycosyltransferase